MVEQPAPVRGLAVVSRRRAQEHSVALPVPAVEPSAALAPGSRRGLAPGSVEPVSAVPPASKPPADAGFQRARIRLATPVVVPVKEVLRRDHAAQTRPLPAAGS